MYLYAVVVNGHVKSDLTYNQTLQWPGQLLFYSHEREQERTGDILTLLCYVQDVKIQVNICMHLLMLYIFILATPQKSINVVYTPK